MVQVKTVDVISDIHVPSHCRPSIVAWLNFTADNPPDELVLNGDILDLHSCSSHGDALSEDLLKDEIAAGNDFLDLVQDAVGPKCKIHFNEGNHERRFTRYIHKVAPNLRGVTTLPQLLHLERRGISWLPYGKVHFLSDKLGVTHGVKCGANYARDTLIRYGMSVVVGHAHRPQLHTMGVAGADADAIRGAFGLGCMVPVDDVTYIDGPSGWSNGFGRFYILPDGTFTPYVINFARQKFVWNGKVYGV